MLCRNFYTDTCKIKVCLGDSVLRRHRGSIHECKSWCAYVAVAEKLLNRADVVA